jgi:tetratricopeptide (TPR) repeat protein
MWSVLLGVAALTTTLVVEPRPVPVAPPVVEPATRQVVVIIPPSSAVHGGEEEAVGTAESVAAPGPRVASRDEYLRRAERFAAREAWERALVAYTWARDVDPRCVEAHVGRAMVLLELRRPREAAVAVRRALALAADDGEALVLQGLLAQLQGRSAEARAQYEAYLVSHPEGRWAGELRVILGRGESSFAKVMRP